MRVSFLAVSLAVYKGALAAPADASVSENKNIKAKHWDGGPDVMPNFQDDQGNGYGVVSAPNRQTQYLPRIACDPNNVGNSPYCPNYRPNQGYGNGYRPPPYGIGPACDANDPGCQLPHPTNHYGNGHPPCDSNNMYGNPNCANYYPNQHFGPGPACDLNNVGNYPHCPNYRPNQGSGNGYRPPPYGIGPACDANDPGCQLPRPTNPYGNGHPPCDSNNMYGNPNCANYYPNQHFGPGPACNLNNVGNYPHCPNYRPNQGSGNGYRPHPYGIGPACDANDPGCQLPHPTNPYGNGHPPCDSNNMYGNPNCANYYPNQHFGPGPACDPYNTGNYPNCPNYRPNHHYGDGLPPYHDIQHFGSGPACDPNNVNNNSNCPNNSPRPDYSNELPSCDSEKKYNNPYCYDH